MITLDWSRHGFMTGLKKATKVIGYYILSGLLIAAAAFVTDHQGLVSQDNTLLVSLFALVNAVLVLAQRWLTTIRPTALAS